jgi:hypothetical protein
MGHRTSAVSKSRAVGRHALRAQPVTMLVDRERLSDARYLQALAQAASLRLVSERRNGAARRGAKLPRYDSRSGRWKGGDSRTLYTFGDPATGRMSVVPGEYNMPFGPQATVRVATRDEAEALWQQPLHPGWQVLSEELPRNAAGEPSHVAILRRVANEQFAALQRGAIVSTSSTVQGAIASAPPSGGVIVRGEYTSDGTHWGLGRGRLVASRENGRWVLG